MKKLLMLLTLTTSLCGNVFIPDIYITKRLLEDGLWRDNIKPLFFESGSKNNILKRLWGSDKNLNKQKISKLAKEKYQAKEVFLSTKDSFCISSLYYKRDKAPLNIVYATGYFENFTPLKEWCAPFAALFPSFNIFTFDWRGYGNSSGNAQSDFGSNAYNDVLAAIEYVRKDNDKPIVLIGFCMGGAISLHSALKAKEEGRIAPDALVLNSPFTNFMNIMGRVAKDPDLNLVQRLAINNSILFHLKANRLNGNLLHLKPAEMIKDLDIPLYIEHSMADKMVPVSEGVTVFNNAKTYKMFMKSEIGSHVRIHSSIPYQYRNAFYKFLEGSSLLTSHQVKELLAKEKLEN